MSLETTWFTFRIEFDNAESLDDKIPAETKAEALATARRIYSQARSIRLIDTETRESIFAHFRPGMTNSFATTNMHAIRPEDYVRFTCPECRERVRFDKTNPGETVTCSSCKTVFRIEREDADAPFIISGANPTPNGRHNDTGQPRQNASSNQHFGHYGKRPWHEVLETVPSADISTVRAAYLEQIRLYHPDKVAHMGAQLIAYAEARTAEINQALQEALKSRKPQINNKT